MPVYSVIFEAEVCVTVEAETEEEAEELARSSFRWTDVDIVTTIDIQEED